MLLHLLFGCDFSAATGVSGETGRPADTAGDDVRDTAAGRDDTASDSGGSTAPPDPLDVDDDGDGAAESDGDCDDADPAVHPGAGDICNGRDDDCDDATDEDATPDAWEPNDVSAARLGDLDADPELTAVGTLSGDDDVDRFAFTLTDSSWSLFSVAITLDGIPDDATYRLTLNRLASDGALPAEELDQVFGSGSLAVGLEDESWQEDGGTYEVIVEAVAGADCARSYLLSVAW